MSFLTVSLVKQDTKVNYSNNNTVVTKPQQSNLSQNINNFSKETNAFYSYFLGGQNVSFNGGISSFRIKKLEDVPCPCCGQIMLTQNSIPKHVNRLNKAKGDKLADRIINEEQPYLRSNERACAMMVAKEVKGTDLNLSAGMKKVAENLPKNFISHCCDTIMDAIVVCDEQLGENSEIASFLWNKAENLTSEKEYYRPTLTEELSKFKSSISEEKYHKIEDAVMKLPLDFETVEKIFDATKNGNPTAIATKLYSPSLATAEHVLPHSLGGENKPSNFLSECAGCNNPRSSKPYTEWIKVHPEFLRNPQIYIEHVENRIINGELPESYDSYPVDIKKTLTKESNGHIKLTVLDKAKLAELRAAKKAGQEVNIQAETEKAKEQEENNN